MIELIREKFNDKVELTNTKKSQAGRNAIECEFQTTKEARATGLRLHTRISKRHNRFLSLHPFNIDTKFGTGKLGQNDFSTN